MHRKKFLNICLLSTESQMSFWIRYLYFDILVWSMSHPLTWRRQGFWRIQQPATRGRLRRFGFTFWEQSLVMRPSLYTVYDLHNLDVNVLTTKLVSQGLNKCGVWQVFCFSGCYRTTHCLLVWSSHTVICSLWCILLWRNLPLVQIEPDSMSKYWTPQFIYRNWIYFRLWQLEFL